MVTKVVMKYMQGNEMWLVREYNGKIKGTEYMFRKFDDAFAKWEELKEKYDCP